MAPHVPGRLLARGHRSLLLALFCTHTLLVFPRPGPPLRYWCPGLHHATFGRARGRGQAIAGSSGPFGWIEFLRRRGLTTAENGRRADEPRRAPCGQPGKEPAPATIDGPTGAVRSESA